MFTNYLKIACRNLTINKVSSIINISGLAIGMAVATLIGLWIWDECSFNTYHDNYDRIGMVMYSETRDGETGTSKTTPIPMGVELRSSFKDDFKYIVMSTQPGDHIIAAGDKVFTQSGNYMQPEAPALFTLKMVRGSDKGLDNLHTVLLAQSLAKKLFGDSDPVGKVVKMDNKTDVKVTGVYEDLPHNSELNGVTFIAPWDLYMAVNDKLKEVKNPWRNNFLRIYVQLAAATNFDKVSARVKDIKRRNVNAELAARKPVVFVYPMRKWHLYSTFENGVPVTSEAMKFIWFYGIIGLFVLLLACINFMNLSTARSEKRAREVGVRKAIGSARSQLIGQFFSESLLVVALAFVLSSLLVQLILPWFNGVADKKIIILWANPWFWCCGLGFTIITGLLAGSYPAFYLSSFRPVKVLKGTFRAGRMAAVPRKVLVVLQFTVSIALIIGTIIVYRQIQLAKNRPVGYSRDELLVFRKTTRDFNTKSAVLRTELNKTGVIANIAESGGDVTTIWSGNGGFDWKGKDPELVTYFGTLAVSPGFGKTVGWQMAQGRDFSDDMASDSTAVILNESAVKLMGLQKPVGEIIRWENDWYKGGNLQVIGVVKDMLMESPFSPAKPSVFFLQGSKSRLLVKLKPHAGAAEALAKIETVFKKLFPFAPFEYKFVDEEYDKKFKAEERIGKLASFFAVLAVFISCLGLFGLASFVAEQRTREIGIRKILGASVFHLWQLLSKEFVVLVIIACLIAGPLAWYLLHVWLQQYQLRTGIAWWIFASAGIGALGITLLTVSFHAIKAAITNPVKNLRTE